MKRAGIVAIGLVALAAAVPVQEVGCSQTTHFALVRSLEKGTARIDQYHWQTCDKSWWEGHFYTAKGPGLAVVSLPLYLGLDAAGLAWDELPTKSDPTALYDVPRTAIWPFTLWGVVLPAFLLLLLVRWSAERVAPGYGTAAAVITGAATLVLPYATLYASHTLAVLCGFAAFTLLWKERDGPQRLSLVGLAGALAGFAIVVDNPLGVVALALGVYAVARPGLIRRGLAYGAGVFAGILPLLAYNQWAFGDFTHQAYEGAIIHAGQSGHDVIGANTPGFFGILLPSVHVAVELLLSRKGLLVLTPVVAVGVVALVLLWRRGRRAETLLVAGLALAYLTYNSGYYQPFGGDSAGPRFLVPILPFLAMPLALALSRFPLTTAGLALASAMTMLVATATDPMLGHDDTRTWFAQAARGEFTETVFTSVGAGSGWLAIAPFAVLVAAAAVLAAVATPRVRLARNDLLTLGVALGSWAVVGSLVPLLYAGDIPRIVTTTVGIALLAGSGAAVSVAMRQSRSVPGAPAVEN